MLILVGFDLLFLHNSSFLFLRLRISRGYCLHNVFLLLPMHFGTKTSINLSFCFYVRPSLGQLLADVKLVVLLAVKLSFEMLF